MLHESGQDTTSFTGPGPHNGANNASTLTDTTQSSNWTTNLWSGYTLYNDTDGSSGSVTASSTTTITATLSGGSENDWDVGDIYYLAHATVLTDGNKSWAVNQWAGYDLINDSDGSSGNITSNTANTITVSSLTGGTNNYFRTGDEYRIVVGGLAAGDIIEYKTIDTELRAHVTIDTEGVPTITGPSQTYTFQYRLQDLTDSAYSPYYICEVNV